MKSLMMIGCLVFATVVEAAAFLVDGERVEGELHEENGMRTLCNDEMCILLPDDAVRLDVPAAPSEIKTPSVEVSSPSPESPSEASASYRLAQGYMDADAFLSWLNDESPAEETPFAGRSIALVVLLILLGGLAMNLTPCVLPMIPINLMVIGKSAVRGVWYGLGLALAYGALGVLAAVGGMAFGTIQSNPYFNLAVAVLFVLLALALSGVFFIDLSKKRGGLAQKKATMLPWLFAFFMGAVSAVLAGACVAPILISVLILTAKLYAEGNAFALGLPFLLGLGMALPWPFLGAGLKVLPKPGAWMKWTNRLFALLVLGFAVWYGRLAWIGFAGASAKEVRPEAQDESVIAATPETFPAVLAGLPKPSKPVLVDCWATWCKNCAAMEREVFADEKVKAALADFTVIKLQAEDMKALKALAGFGEVKGLPAFVIIR